LKTKKTNKLNFLDLTIHREHNKLDYTIYRKPTATDILIHNSSCHPNEHKLASINYLTNRVHTYPLSKHAKDTEPNTIKTILQNNQYKLTDIQQKPKINTDPQEKHDNKKWDIFTYAGREIKTISKVPEDANTNIAYKTRNTIEHILRTKLSTATDNIYNDSGIYQLNCLECPKKISCKRAEHSKPDTKNISKPHVITDQTQDTPRIY
jgi:hypothetical protein